MYYLVSSFWFIQNIFYFEQNIKSRHELNYVNNNLGILDNEKADGFRGPNS